MTKKNPQLKIDRKTHEIDASGQTPGRLATQIVSLLRGKQKPTYSPHIDNGDFVVVTNANRLKFTGHKLEQRKYYHHSMHPGGLKMKKMSEINKNKPGDILKRAVSRMLPKNYTRVTFLKRLIIK